MIHVCGSDIFAFLFGKNRTAQLLRKNKINYAKSSSTLIAQVNKSFSLR